MKVECMIKAAAILAAGYFLKKYWDDQKDKGGSGGVDPAKGNNNILERAPTNPPIGQEPSTGVPNIQGVGYRLDDGFLRRPFAKLHTAL
ncbi:MAG: hypothetical protein GXO85_02205 [Chlorobi bacterium]|nr:hypothetical protein [Chlorobiota bacterium]